VKLPDEPLPRRPYRNSAIFYGVLAGAVIVFGLLTGNEAAETVVIAVVFFALATGYTWWRFRQRIQREGTRR
jgi:membrane protein DedA with SNARE-associated domain